MRNLAIGFILSLLIAAALPCSFAAQGRKEAIENPPPAYVPPPAWKSVEIGDFYLHRKNYRGALSRYQEAVQTNPDYAPGYLGLGRVYEKLGEDRQALDAYQKYLSELPSQEQAEKATGVHRSIRRLERRIKHEKRSTSKEQMTSRR